jgi:hypothetical protein
VREVAAPHIVEQLMIDSGGRIAWSCKVIVDGRCIPGRYYFDGIDNAKEDAAEQGLGVLKKRSTVLQEGARAMSVHTMALISRLMLRPSFALDFHCTLHIAIADS